MANPFEKANQVRSENAEIKKEVDQTEVEQTGALEERDVLIKEIQDLEKLDKDFPENNSTLQIGVLKEKIILLDKKIEDTESKKSEIMEGQEK